MHLDEGEGQGTFCPRTNCPRAYIVPGQNVPPEVCYDGGSWVFIGETFCPGGVFRGKTFCPGIRSGTFCPGGNFSTIPDQNFLWISSQSLMKQFFIDV